MGMRPSVSIKVVIQHSYAIDILQYPLVRPTEDLVFTRKSGYVT